MTTSVIKHTHDTPTGSELAVVESELSAEISKAFDSFYSTGKCLQRIRDERLYKQAGFKSFAEYLKARPQFDLSRRHADRLINAKSTADKVQKVRPASLTFEWTINAIQELAHDEIDGRYLKTIVNRIAKRVDDKNPLTAKLVREIRDNYMGWDKEREAKRQEKITEELATSQTPAEVLAEIEATVKVWIDSLATWPAVFWKEATSEYKYCVRDAANALSELASELRKH